MNAAGPAETRRINQRFLKSGFTLIELVVILVLISVLAAVAVPRFTGVSAFELRGFEDEMLAALRYGQKVAVASGCEVDVSFNGGYALALAGAAHCGGSVANPATRGPLSGSVPGGVTLSAPDFSFTPLGSLDGGDVIIILSGDGVTRQVLVVGETGYVVRQ